MNAPVSSSGFRWRRKHFVALAVVLLLLAIAVPPYVSVNRFRRSIVQAISAGLGRPVEASSVGLRLFPRPGFVLHNLTVAEDPAYGAEPVMVAQTVTAGLRASTLWHRRVEIATLRFDAPSVNLVRNSDGHWNFESLLRHFPALHAHAYSGSSEGGARMPFPYVEATEARINFKLGAEKLPFSLEDASLALWKESGHKWRLRIRANPIRTDLTLRDAGQIRGQGTLMTGGALTDAPFRGRLEWRRVQLDGIGRLLHGDDNGWRGTVDWTAEARGTLADVALTSEIAVEDVHRAEFIPPSEMDLSAHCQGRYARNDAARNRLACVAPAGAGQIWLRGFQRAKTEEVLAPTEKNVRHRVALHLPLMIGPVRPRVQIALQKVPAAFLLNVLAHVHPGVQRETTASGEVNGQAECAWMGFEMPAACAGAFHAESVRLRLAQLDHPLMFSPVQVESAPATALSTGLATWKLMPVRVSLGGPTTATVEGAMGPSGMSLQIEGPADLTELGRLAQALRIPAFSGELKSLRGDAALALTLESNWVVQPGESFDSGGASSTAVRPAIAGELEASLPQSVPSRWLGSVTLHGATVTLAALPAPIKLASGHIELNPNGVQWTGLDGTVAGIPFDGSVRWQTPCPAANSPCARGFALHTADLDVARLQKSLRAGVGDNGSLLERMNPWAPGAPSLPAMSGVFRTDVLSLGQISVKNAVLHLRLESRGAQLTGVSGKVFGGTIAGPITGDGAGWVRWGADTPAYEMRVRLAHIQPDEIGALWRERWGGGVADATLDFQTRGRSQAELASNARGMFAFDWSHGALAVISGPPIQFSQWKTSGAIRDRKLVFDSSRMMLHTVSSKNGFRRSAQSVQGSISFARVLHLRLEPSGASIAGALDSPTVTSPR